AKAKYGYGVCIDDVSIMTNSLSWNGTGSWNDNASWVPPFVPAFFDDVTISGGTCTVNNDVSCKTVTVNTGAQLTVTTGKVLTATGNLIINP
ncbi:MAG TPA: hypothetical protein VLR52_02855, partial [Bacteroidales bacterium]|nr:hypothetical protein [Bacteroidales bacterium]